MRGTPESERIEHPTLACLDLPDIVAVEAKVVGAYPEHNALAVGRLKPSLVAREHEEGPLAVKLYQRRETGKAGNAGRG